jgi:hypothetical protein
MMKTSPTWIIIAVRRIGLLSLVMGVDVTADSGDEDSELE